MSPSTPPLPAAPPGPLAPPAEEFWDRYSPHYEFPLSSIGSIVMHVGGLALLLVLLYWLANMGDAKTAVPMTAMTVIGGDGDGLGSPGSGGGNTEERTNPLDQAMDPVRPVPDAKVLEDVKKELKDYLPKFPQTVDALRPEDLDAVKKLANLNDDIRRRLLEGKSGKKGAGSGGGESATDQKGDGNGGKADASSSKSRGIRWVILFKTENGKDYLNQLAAMKATIVVPQPKDWTSHKAYPLTTLPPTGEDFRRENLPGLYFIDDSTAGNLTRAMGLGFDAPMFIAFFPAEIEERMASLERDFRKRKESEIFETKFKVLLRDGKPEITVVEQVPVSR